MLTWCFASAAITFHRRSNGLCVITRRWWPSASCRGRADGVHLLWTNFFRPLPLVSGNNTRAAAGSKIGLSKWGILVFKCMTRMGVFALIPSSLSLRRERMEKTRMFSCRSVLGPGLLQLDQGWEVLDAVLGCGCSISQHPTVPAVETGVFPGGSQHFPLHCKGRSLGVSLPPLDLDEAQVLGITSSLCRLTAYFVLFLTANNPIVIATNEVG